VATGGLTVYWRTVLLTSVLAASCLTGACGNTSLTSPGSVDETNSSLRPPLSLAVFAAAR
jgi:hypothetical protein